MRNLHNVGTSRIYRKVENCILILCSATGDLHTNKRQIYQIHELRMHLRFLDYSEAYNEHCALLTRQKKSRMVDATVAYSIGLCCLS